MLYEEDLRYNFENFHGSMLGTRNAYARTNYGISRAEGRKTERRVRLDLEDRIAERLAK